MNGPGRALKDPLPHSTNYLGAYDKFGNLVRGSGGFQPGEKKAKEAQDGKTAVSDGTEVSDGKAVGKPEATMEGQESADELDTAVAQEEKTAQGYAGAEEGRLPPETLEDLRPFPLNKFFRSQPVLSEDLREAIHQFVARDGHSLQLASTAFGVSNERVGAVVRLKQMEKEWIAKVRTLTPSHAP